MFSLSHRAKGGSVFSLSSLANYLKQSPSSFSYYSPRCILYLLLLFFLPTQLGKHFWPSFSSVAGIRIDYLSPTIYVTDVLITMLFAVTCYEVFRKKKAALALRHISRFLLQNVFFSASLISFVVGACLSATPLLSSYYLLRFGEIVFVAYSTKWFLETSPASVRLFIVVLLVTLFLESSLGIFQFFLQHSLEGVMYFFGERSISPGMPGVAFASISGELVLRPYGTFSHPNALAGFLLVTGGIVGSLLYLRKNDKALKAISVFLCSFAAIALMLTLSRTAIIVFACSLLVLLVIFYRSFIIRIISFLQHTSLGSLRFHLISTVVAGMLLLGFLLTPVITNRFLAQDFFGESYHERLILAVAALEMMFDNPFYGVGIGQFISELPAYVPSFYFSLLQPVHSIFLLLLAETGVVGVVGVASIVVVGIRKQIRNKNKVVLLPLCLCLLLGVSDHYLLTQQQGRLMIAVVLGILFVDSKMLGHRLMKNTKKG